MKIFEKGFNYSQDGPGNRLVYHLQGCNMHCPWCSNPEGMSCKGWAKIYSVEEISQEILSCVPMFFDGGGVTFTGGEASLQAHELKKLLPYLKEHHIHTAIETNGTSAELTELLNYIDYWMIDFKHPDSDVLRNVTGVGNKQVKQNIMQIALREKVHIRIPLIHGFNDDRESLEGFKAFFCMLLNRKAKFDVELLSYHEYGKEKWLKEGKVYTIANGFVSKEKLSGFERELMETGIEIIRT